MNLTGSLPIGTNTRTRGAGAAFKVFEQRQFLENALKRTAVYAQSKEIVLKIPKGAHLKGKIPHVQLSA